MKTETVVELDDRGPWIQTYSGKHLHLLDPTPDEIDIKDIAHALSLVCRFNGHITKFYSVAEHSVYVSRLVPESQQLAGLLHDATEAYIGDVVSPLKGALPEYKRIEDNFMQVMAKKFGFEYPLTKEVHDADKRQLHKEARILLKGSADWVPPVVPGEHQGLKPYGLSPKQAENLFLTWYTIYTGK